MAYYINLFSPETYETFSKSNREVPVFVHVKKMLLDALKLGTNLFAIW